MSRYYPIFLDMRGRKCLVVGGGSVAYRKAVQLLRSGARVRVVAPSLSSTLRKLGRRDSIDLRERTYRPSDISGSELVFAATDDSSVNRQIRRDARSSHALVNVVDASDKGDFIMPAIIKKNRITIAVSTDGTASYAAVLIKERIEKLMSPGYMKLMDAVIRVRSRLMRIKKSGVNIDIGHELKRLSLGRLSRDIRRHDTASTRRYSEDFIASCVRRGK